jgi:hypothetical protein
MSEEVELAAKTSGAIVSALAQESGVLGPIKQFADYVSQRIGLYLAPKLAERAQAAAKKVEESGLPRRAFGEFELPLLTAILEGMAEETNPDLHDAWENLLANALTNSDANVARAFPKILSELEPIEARMLNDLADEADSGTMEPDQVVTLPGSSHLDNLARVGLFRRLQEQVDTRFQTLHGPPRVAGYTFTAFGWEFMRTCRPPKANGTGAATVQDIRQAAGL